MPNLSLDLRIGRNTEKSFPLRLLGYLSNKFPFTFLFS